MNIKYDCYLTDTATTDIKLATNIMDSSPVENLENKLIKCPEYPARFKYVKPIPPRMPTGLETIVKSNIISDLQIDMNVATPVMSILKNIPDSISLDDVLISINQSGLKLLTQSIIKNKSYTEDLSLYNQKYEEYKKANDVYEVAVNEHKKAMERYFLEYKAWNLMEKQRKLMKSLSNIEKKIAKEKKSPVKVHRVSNE